MWSVIYMAEGLELANEIEKKLQAEGFLVKKKLFSREGNNTIYEILVPEFEAQDARSILFDY